MSCSAFLQQDIEVTEGARAEARKKRRTIRKRGDNVPYMPTGPLPVMPTPVHEALHRLHPWFDPGLIFEVRSEGLSAALS